MTLAADAMSGLGAALLPVVAALLFEELTCGGLVRLLIAPWPGTRKDGAAKWHADGKSTRTDVLGDHPQTRDRLAGSLKYGGGK